MAVGWVGPLATGRGGMTTRERLHALVDALPEASVEPAAVLLDRAMDPAVAQLEAAPWDDEPYTAAQQALVAAALTDLAPSLSWDQAQRELAAD